jgi:2-keto-4-pentenoate hydratase/2-oxohepta-3-ene-1,7-dioic acid hydratase in catechol pathway
MKLLSYDHHGRPSYGILRDQTILDLGRRFADRAPTLQALLALPNWREEVDALVSSPADIDLGAVTLLPVITRPSVIACVGHNYEEHRLETRRDPTEHPSIFFRHAESLQGSGSPIVRPRESGQLDFEGELAVVIGRGGRRIAEDRAWDHIAGVSCFNDGSVRDWQHHTRQFGPGKNFARTAGFGPWLVTPDELPTDRVLRLVTRLNGREVQGATTDMMIFSIGRIVAYVSTFMTLSPGDVIATGTPGGVGAKRTPPLWMQPGDTVEVEVSAVGVLSNPVVDELP